VEKGQAFDIKNTEYGSALINAGFTEGLNDFEENQFWKKLVKNTGDAASYTDRTADNTQRDNGSTMSNLLSKINQNTASGAWAVHQAQAEAAGKGTLITEFEEKTNFKLSELDKSALEKLPENEKVANLSNWINQTETSLSKQDWLIERNQHGEDLYKAYSGVDLGENAPLSQTDFYKKLNSGEGVGTGFDDFTSQNLENYLRGVEGS
jgi:hypothetical protein